MPSFHNSQRNFENKQEIKGYPPLNKHREKILVVVTTRPHPSVKYREIVCTASITETGKWIRLYPIGYRYLDYFLRFHKYQWVSVEIEKNKQDSRIDSYRPNLKSLRLLSKPLPAGKWTERKRIVLPTVSQSLEAIKEKYNKYGISLGVFKPKEITDFLIEGDDREWSPKHIKVLTQRVLFGKQPKPLEKIPFKFSYCFRCNNPKCKSHKLQIIDWEIYELYRNVRDKYSYSLDVILEKVKQKWLGQMWSKDRDSYLIVGSRFPYPSFQVIGVFWPPKTK